MEFKMTNSTNNITTISSFFGKWDNGQGNPIIPTMAGSLPLAECMLVDFEESTINNVFMSPSLLLASHARTLWIEGGYKKSFTLSKAIERSGRGFLTASHESKNKGGTSKKEVVLTGHVIAVSEHITNSIKLATDNMEYLQLKAVHEFISTFTGLVSDDTNDAISRHCIEYEENLIKFDGLMSDVGFTDLVTVGKLYTVKTEYSLKECNQALDKHKFIKVSFDGEVLTFTDLK